MIYIDRSRIPEPQILHKLDRQNKTETEKAIEFYKKSLKIKTEVNDKRGIAACYDNIGVVYYEKNNFFIICNCKFDFL